MTSYNLRRTLEVSSQAFAVKLSEEQVASIFGHKKKYAFSILGIFILAILCYFALRYLDPLFRNGSPSRNTVNGEDVAISHVPSLRTEVLLSTTIRRGASQLIVSTTKVGLEVSHGIAPHSSIVINPGEVSEEIANLTDMVTNGAENTTELKLQLPLQHPHSAGEAVIKLRHTSLQSASTDQYQHIINKTQAVWSSKSAYLRGHHALISVESAPDDIPQMALTAANVDILNAHAERHYLMLIMRLTESVEMELNALVYHYLESRFLTDVRKSLK